MRNLFTTFYLTLSLIIVSSAAISEEFKTISTREGVTVSFIKNTPLKATRSAAILFAGGDGDIGIDVGAKTVDSNNFLVRSRKLFSDLGILTITPDAPSDLDSLKNRRNSLDYRADITRLIAEIRNETPKPIWLIGTSRGSNTVGYHAAELKIQGVVLTATVTEGNNDTIWHTDFKNINVPALVVHHKNDACHVSPSDGAKAVLAHLTNSPKKHQLLFENGDIGSGRDCAGTTFHGFLGIEKQVVASIAEWMYKATKKKN